MSFCVVAGYDPKRVETISGQHTLAGYRQGHLWGLSRAVWDTSPQSMERESGVRIKPAESFYGSLAKTFLEMPTTLRQMLQRTFWRLRDSRKSRGVCFGVCGYSRKSRGVCFGVCGSPASLAAFALAFAGIPASLAAFALAFAGTPASLAANARAFAGVPQERFPPFWRLQDCCKHFQRLFGRYNMLSETFSMNKGISFFCRTHVMDSIGTLA